MPKLHIFNCSGLEKVTPAGLGKGMADGRLGRVSLG